MTDQADRLACLEYGKLCETVDGPIFEHGEASVLAASPEVDPSLLVLCTPSAWGLSDDQAGSEAAQHFGLTIFVAPIMLQGRLIRAGAAFRRRPELGEGQAGRQFWRARFVIAGDALAEVGTVVAALTSRPLTGWTQRTEIDDPGPGLIALPGSGAPPWTSTEVRRWCARAARAVEHGVSVGLDESVGVAQFFALAAALEAALPVHLRPLFSAGWGVARDRARSVALACGRDFPPDVDTFDRARDAWTTADNSAGPPPAPTIASLLVPRAARWIRFSDAEVRQCIHAVRRTSESERRLRAVAAWLDEGALDDVPALDERDGVTGLAALADLLAGTIDDPPRAARAEALLIATWQGPLRKGLIGELRATPRSAQLALVVALLDGAPAEVVTALHRASRMPGPWTAARLTQALDASLVPEREVVAAHAAFLCDPAALAERPAYAAWAAARAGTLALYIAALGPEDGRQRAVGVLANLSDSADVAAISAVLDDPPPPDLAAVASSPLRPVLIKLALRRWTAPRDAGDRAAGLAWLDALDARPDHPLLRDGPVAISEVDDLTRELAGGAVPEPLLDRLAARALRFTGSFRRAMRDQPQAWQRVVARWPRPVIALLAPATCRSGVDPAIGGDAPIAPALDDAAAAVTLPASELETIGRAAAGDHAFDGAAGLQLASLYVDWCRPRAPARGGAPMPTPLVDAVRWVWHGGDAPGRRLDDESTAAMLALFRQLRPDDDQMWMRWESARSPGALLLLMRLCGGPVREPTIAQLEQLLTCGPQVAAFVRGVPWSQRLAPLDVCGRGWQEIDVRTSGERLWRPEYAGTMLSGVFAGLRPTEEAPLDKLLDFFARQTRRQRWDLAAEWLRGRRQHGDDDAERVWNAVVEQACRAAGIDRKQFDALVAYAEGKPVRKPRIDIHPSAAADQPVIVVGDELWLHPGFAHLLRGLRNHALADQRRAAYAAPHEQRMWPRL